MKVNGLNNLTSTKESKQEIDMVPSPVESNMLSLIQKLERLHIDLVTTGHAGCIKRFQSTESAMKKPGKHFRCKGWSIHPCDKSKLIYGWGLRKDKCYFRVDWKVWKDRGAFDQKQNEQCWGLCIIISFLYLQRKLLREAQIMKLSWHERSHEFSYFVLVLGV